MKVSHYFFFWRQNRSSGGLPARASSPLERYLGRSSGEALDLKSKNHRQNFEFFPFFWVFFTIFLHNKLKKHQITKRLKRKEKEKKSNLSGCLPSSALVSVVARRGSIRVIRTPSTLEALLYAKPRSGTTPGKVSTLDQKEHSPGHPHT